MKPTTGTDQADGGAADNVSYTTHIQNTVDEFELRRRSRLVRRGDEARRLVETLEYRSPAALVDPGIGFQARTLRMFLSRVPPEGTDITKSIGPLAGTALGHRHTVEAVIYMLNGAGYSVIDGVRHEWRGGDFINVPVFAWHRHVNTGRDPAWYLAAVTVPFHRAIGLSIFEDELYPENWIFRREDGEDAWSSSSAGAQRDGAEERSLYEAELTFASEALERRRSSRVRRSSADIAMSDTPMGSIGYAVDPRIGSNAYVLAAEVWSLSRESSTGRHRHMYEEAFHVEVGAGRTDVGERSVEWTAGDTVFLPPLEWHQHHTGDEDARLLAFNSRPLTENIGLAVTEHV